MTLTQNLGIRIKHYRRLRRLTQEQLAEKVNLSLNFIGLIEIGRSTPSLKSLNRIAKALNTPPHTLLKFTEASPSSRAMKRKILKSLDQLTPRQLEFLGYLLDKLPTLNWKS